MEKKFFSIGIGNNQAKMFEKTKNGIFKLANNYLMNYAPNCEYNLSDILTENMSFEKLRAAYNKEDARTAINTILFIDGAIKQKIIDNFLLDYNSSLAIDRYFGVVDEKQFFHSGTSEYIFEREQYLSKKL